MVTYNYTVSYDGPTYTIQEAINKVAAELRIDPVIERDIIIDIADGAYAGAVIPDGALFPLLNTSYKLKIQSAGKYFPIIDFNLGHEDINVGIDVGAGNPNVVVSGLKIQYFAVGVRANTNSHYLIVNNCIIVNNRNAGIFATNIDQFQAIQNIIINGDYGIVAHLCKEISIIHNTIFQNGSIATIKGKSISGLWLEGALDYGNLSTDTGVIVIIGNIVWNLCGTCLTLFHDQIEYAGAVQSNYNNFVHTENKNLISIEDRTFYRGSESRPRLTYENLISWKSTGLDANSISADPKFIAPVRIRSDKNGYSLDLTLLSASPVLGIVPSYYVDVSLADTDLPVYVDREFISKDILGNVRSVNGTAAGANDKPSSSAFFGQDVTSDPLTTDLEKDCNIDPLLDIVSNNLDIWYPSIKPGYFYSNEREYYLYANKECKNIGALARSIFRLPSRIAIEKPIEILVAGKVITSDYYDVLYDEVVIYHKDLLIITLDEEVTINASIAKWKDNGFGYQQTQYIFKFRDAETKFYLPDTFKSGPPVVITDDKAGLTDSDFICNKEFTLKFDDKEQKTEIIFNNKSNQIFNSQFDYDVSGAPYLWGSTGCSVVSLNEVPFPIAGSNVCAIYNSGSLSQILKYNEVPACLSFFHTTNGTGILNYNLHCYDRYNEDLGFVITGSINSVNTWSREALVLGATSSSQSGLISSDISNIIYHYIPEETTYILFNILYQSNEVSILPLYMDAVQYEFNDYPSIYHRGFFLNEMTVEYETGEGSFIDRHQAIAPVRNYLSDGFLYIESLPAKIYDGPDDPAITTLHEWRWPEGRKNIIPWSRTKGKDKLLYRPNGLFNKEPIAKPELIIPISKVASINEINIIPAEPVIRQGDEVGIAITLISTDNNSNPLALATYKASVQDNNLNYPGLLFKSFFGLKHQLGNTISSRLDNAGVSNFVWVPPSKADSVLVTKLPKPGAISQLNDRIVFFKTKYPVSLDNHANVVILDADGNRISTEDPSYINVTKVTKKADGFARVELDYPIAFDSVSVIIDNVKLKETFIATPDSNQFFVDYENSIIIVKSKATSISISYRPQYVILNRTNPYYIGVYFDKVFTRYSVGAVLTIGYDYIIPLTIAITDPASSTPKVQTFQLTAQNYLLSELQIKNSIALEI